MSSRYIIRRQQEEISMLRQELARYKNENVISTKKNQYIPLYQHHVTVWLKNMQLKIKFNVGVNYHHVGYVDNYNWELIYSYVQISFFPLEFRYYYFISL